MVDAGVLWLRGACGRDVLGTLFFCVARVKCVCCVCVLTHMDWVSIVRALCAILYTGVQSDSTLSPMTNLRASQVMQHCDGDADSKCEHACIRHTRHKF